MDNTLSKELLKKNSFDFLRFIFATSVIFSHSFSLKAGMNLLEPLSLTAQIYKNFGNVAVFSFFILSGFLLTRSWILKPNTLTFFKKRISRIFPGIIVATLVTILILGFFSGIPYQEYILHKQTVRYLSNFFLYPIHYSLPGIFQNNPYIYTVNGSLWSISYEWTCYVILTIIGSLGLLSIRKEALPITYVFVAILYYFEIGKNVTFLFSINLYTLFSLFLFFLSGSLFYVHANKIPLNKYLMLFCVPIFIFLLFSMKMSFLYVFLGPITLTYILIFISYNTPYLNEFSHKIGDLSYGLYIYAFPTQQLLISLSKNTLSISELFISSFFISFLFAYISWHFVEKQFLNKDKH